MSHKRKVINKTLFLDFFFKLTSLIIVLSFNMYLLNMLGRYFLALYTHKTVVCRNNDSIPKDVYILIPRICEYVRLCGKGELSLQMELRLLIR